VIKHDKTHLGNLLYGWDERLGPAVSRNDYWELFSAFGVCSGVLSWLLVSYNSGYVNLQYAPKKPRKLDKQHGFYYIIVGEEAPRFIIFLCRFITIWLARKIPRV